MLHFRHVGSCSHRVRNRDHRNFRIGKCPQRCLLSALSRQIWLVGIETLRANTDQSAPQRKRMVTRLGKVERGSEVNVRASEPLRRLLWLLVTSYADVNPTCSELRQGFVDLRKAVRAHHRATTRTAPIIRIVQAPNSSSKRQLGPDV